jgi:hypothetical protein
MKRRWTRWVCGGLVGAWLIGMTVLATYAHPLPPLPQQPEVRFCINDYTVPPRGREERDARITAHARAEIVTYAGNIGKWWFPLLRRSDGKTVRDLHPGVKILQYLSAGEFVGTTRLSDPVRAPEGPTAYLHTRTFTVPEFLRIARAAGGFVPDVRDPKPYGFADGILEFFGGPLTLRANPGGADFIAYARRYAAAIRKQGGDGVFLDDLNGPAWFLPGMSGTGGRPIRLPPWCFRMRGGEFYWQREQAGRPVPSLADLKAGKREALAQIADVASCRATGAPREFANLAQMERAEEKLVRALKASGPGMVVFNGLYWFQTQHALRLLRVADGAMMEGFVVRQRPASVWAALDLARRAGQTGRWVLVQEAHANQSDARYSYAAYLLVAAPNVCWGGTVEVSDVPEMKVPLGQARGSYETLPEGEGNPKEVVYHRRFERGEVFLNPQDRPMSIPGAMIPARSGLVRPLGLADAH